MFPASRGLVVAGAKGYIFSYENKSFEYGAPYALLQSKIGHASKDQTGAGSMGKSPKNAPEKDAQDDKSKEDIEQITSLCLSEPEDQIYTINRNN